MRRQQLDPSSSSSTSLKKRASRGIFDGLKIFIIQAKLSSEEIAELIDLAELNGADIQADILNADVIITAIGMKARLERHIPWNEAVSSEPMVMTMQVTSIKLAQEVHCDASLDEAISQRRRTTIFPKVHGCPSGSLVIDANAQLYAFPH
jgi:DNA polymerase mu